MRAKAIARDILVVVDTPGADKAQILPRVALVKATFLDVLVFGCDQRCDRQQIRRSLARTKNHVADAADKRFDNIFNAMQFLF